METVASVGAKKTTLETLEGLGARRLAELLLEFGEEDAEIKRRLRFELAGEAGAEVIAADITKRLAALRRARSFIDWQQRRSLVKDLDRQREMISTKVAEARPDLALDLMWRFMDLAEPTLNRVDDSSGDVGDVFRADPDLRRITLLAEWRAEALAEGGLKSALELRVRGYDSRIRRRRARSDQRSARPNDRDAP